MQVPIVPETTLQGVREGIERLVSDAPRPNSINREDPDYGFAFILYLFFSLDSSISSVLGIDLNEEQRFYNAYYWFQRFASLYMRKHGYDAGLEQQAFKMLENANCDLDLSVIEMLDRASN